MQFFGVILHHSACPTINGKGFDFFVTASGAIIPGSEQTDPHYIHICLEGDFRQSRESYTAQQKEQLFLVNKLVIKLAQTYRFDLEDVFPHDLTCPGRLFPWSELVISPKDEYH